MERRSELSYEWLHFPIGVLDYEEGMWTFTIDMKVQAVMDLALVLKFEEFMQGQCAKQNNK